MVKMEFTAVQKDLERLFKIAGFLPIMNKRIKGHKADLFVKIKNKALFVKCIKSGLPLKEAVSEWKEKNKIIQADRILLLLSGTKVSRKVTQAEARSGVLVWDEHILQELLDQAIEKWKQIKPKLIAALLLSDKKVSKKKTPNKEAAAGSMQRKIIKENLTRFMKSMADLDFVLKIRVKDSDTTILVRQSKTGIFYFNFFLHEEIKERFADVLKKEGFKKRSISTSELNDDRGDIHVLYAPKKIIETAEKIKIKEYFFVNTGYEIIGIIQFGKDTKFISSIIDTFFREVYQAGADYSMEFNAQV
ncbi:MAG: hypothetical protein KAK00_09660 [Nanoarchaeota archaeon]|nr:hypothetical protein [Nanoarchaeota archaeon]